MANLTFDTRAIVKFQAQDGLLWRRWDDEYVVYNPASGESHLLDFVSAQGLMQLEKCVVSTEQLVRDLSLVLDIPGDEELSRYVQQMITELSELGLTRSVRS
jgi:PqqD family protein of HPr-rel-A system